MHFDANLAKAVGTILAYVFYWLSIIAALVYMKWQEGRFTLFGLKSKAYYRRMERTIVTTDARGVSTYSLPSQDNQDDDEESVEAKKRTPSNPLSANGSAPATHELRND